MDMDRFMFLVLNGRGCLLFEWGWKFLYCSSLSFACQAVGMVHFDFAHFDFAQCDAMQRNDLDITKSSIVGKDKILMENKCWNVVELEIENGES
jgi:NADH:ubiquinone oxidoreductase subunit B-like Fe-S oxidoreductase